MRWDQHIHPEFGFLVPTPRFRRELRIAFVSMLLGMVIGVVVHTALTHRDNDRGAAFAIATGGRIAEPSVDSGSDGRTGVAKVHTSGTGPEKTGNHLNVSKPAPDSRLDACQGHDASCPTAADARQDRRSIDGRALGVPNAPAPGISQTDRTDFTPVAPLAAAVTQVPGSTTEGLRQDATPESMPQRGKKFPKATRGENPSRPESLDSRRRDTGKIWMDRAEDGSGRAYAHDSSAPRRGFWDWSR
jgi:hypothetical protein